MRFSLQARRSLVMGMATLIGSLLPAIPYAFLERTAASAVAAGIILACVGAIGEIRSRATCQGAGTVAVFGAFDGLTCALSVVGVELWARQPLHVIIVSAAGLAGGGAVSMAAGEWLADSFGTRRWIAYAQTAATLLVAGAVGIVLSILAGTVG